MKIFNLFLLFFFVTVSYTQIPNYNTVSNCNGNLSLQSIQFEAGWNLVSIPLIISDGTKNLLFPTATSQAFLYNNGYQSKDTLDNGPGFWLKFDSSETVFITGDEIYKDTIEVQNGWNIIGSLSTPVVVSTINSLPPGIIASGFFRYTDGYTVADTIYPGEGCWVKVNQSGLIILSSITPTVTYGGKIYHTEKIGDQWWLKENIDIGTMIQGADTGRNNGLIEKYCYNNDTVNCNTYGGLYQWNEAMQYAYGSTASYKMTTGTNKTMQYAAGGEQIQGVCPPGWHIATIADYETLLVSAGGSANALKAIGQGSGAGAGTNTTGFSALLAGRRDSSGQFRYLGVYSNIWCSDTGAWPSLRAILTSGCPCSQTISNMEDNGIISASPRDDGCGVRCVKDEGPPAPTLNSPSNGSTEIAVPPTLMWNASEGATSYTLQVSTDSLFSSYTYNQSGLTAMSQQVAGLNNSTKYYWHVRTTNSEGTSAWSARWSFTTTTSCPGTPTIAYSGQTYNTVLIGGKCWIKENLDVGIMIQGSDTSRDNGTIEKYCYNNDTVNCNTYGGLYQWNEAMQYAYGSIASYKMTTGTNKTMQYVAGGEQMQGICPPGWHIATIADYETLLVSAGGSANALKAIGQGSGAGAGTNTTGFSALLAGRRDSSGQFRYLGVYSNIWCSDTGAWPSLRAILTSGCPCSQSISNMDDNGIISASPRDDGCGVRCVKDEGPPAPTLNSPSNGSTEIAVPPTLMWNASEGATSYTLQVSTDSLFSSYTYNQSGLTGTSQQVTGLIDSTKYYWHVRATNSEGTSAWSARWSFTTGTACAGTLTVNYAGKIYNTVPIGDQCWFKENLNVGIKVDSLQNQSNNGVIEKYCYGNDSLICITYGGLYQWKEALLYDTIPPTQGICPPGWHIPTQSEFQTLKTSVSNNGNALKAVGQGTGGGAGTNTSGFSALLTGYRDFNNGSFYNMGVYTFIWSSSEDNSTTAFDMALYNNSSLINLSYSNNKDYGFPVRCLKD